MSAEDGNDASPSVLELPHDDPTAVALAQAVRVGDVDAVRRVIAQRPELASARLIRRGGHRKGWRTPLHLTADWPGYFPAAPEIASVLLAAGANPNDSTGGSAPETPLHWTASTDDVDVAVVLIDGGADLETPGGSIGTQLDNAVGYGCWAVARLLVARGAPANKLWHAAALGLLRQVEDMLRRGDGTPEDVSQAFWHACAGGQRRVAERLMAKGADLNWIPDYATGTPIDAVQELPFQREALLGWLRDHGARSAGSAE